MHTGLPPGPRTRLVGDARALRSSRYIPPHTGDQQTRAEAAVPVHPTPSEDTFTPTKQPLTDTPCLSQLRTHIRLNGNPEPATGDFAVTTLASGPSPSAPTPAWNHAGPI